MTAAATLLIWGLVVHLAVDWLGQNEWMAVNKAKRRERLQEVRVIDRVDNVAVAKFEDDTMTVEGKIGSGSV